jgi:threonine dehydrogenase-like Zn-dependent dehydrogenase
MRAVVVRPNSPGRVEMIEIQRPTVGRGEVLVAMRDVGVDGTDHEVIEAKHGNKPPLGEDYLILGHESLGQVVQVSARTKGLREGDWVVCTVRRPDGCPNCRRDQIDMCLWGDYTERGIKGAHGYLAELVTEKPRFIIPVPEEICSVGSLIEPLSIDEKAIAQAWLIQRRMHWEARTALVFGLGPIGILAAMLLRLRGLDTFVYSRDPVDSPEVALIREIGAHYISTETVPEPSDLRDTLQRVDLMIEATGSAEIAAAAMTLVPPNGILCLLSITGASEPLTLDVAALNQRLVLGNGVIFGSVNSSRPHFEQAISDLAAFEERWPGVTGRLITRRVPFQRYEEAFAEREGDVKVLIEVSRAEYRDLTSER